MSAAEAVVQRSAELDDEARGPVRDLILALADSKRLLGMRYAEWILGAPELEAGIACASMAQDEWGHARLTYSLLRDFGDDVDALEHGREPADYRSMEALDTAPESWAGLIALNALVDGAMTIQFEALRSCRYEPIRQRCEKLLEEERFHEAHARAWTRRFAEASPAARAELAEAFEAITPAVLAWFGPDDGPGATLAARGISGTDPTGLRSALTERLAPLYRELAAEEVLESAGLDFSSFDASRRRRGGGGPDEDTIRRVRGDHNRAFLMD